MRKVSFIVVNLFPSFGCLGNMARVVYLYNYPQENVREATRTPNTTVPLLHVSNLGRAK